MEIWILDDSLRISIYYEPDDGGFEDNICVSIYESCPDNEKILIADETNIYMTPEQASLLAEALKTAVEKTKNAEGRG